MSDPVANHVAQLAEAVAALSRVDPIIARLVAIHGVPILDRTSLVELTSDAGELPHGSVEDRLFSELVEVVVHQQLAGKAALAISGRVKAALENDVAPERILASDPELLRGTGLSGAKLSAIIGLATEICNGNLSLGALSHLSDGEITERLSKLKGFGPWSAQMFLIFSLKRMDVWPAGDLGVRKGYFRSYGLDSVPTAKDLLKLGDRFRPYRSLVAWYMWRSLSD